MKRHYKSGAGVDQIKGCSTVLKGKRNFDQFYLSNQEMKLSDSGHFVRAVHKAAFDQTSQRLTKCEKNQKVKITSSSQFNNLLSILTQKSAQIETFIIT